MTRVLVVDDEPQLLELLALMLRLRGHEVCTATSGAAALSEAARRPPDIVLCDVLAPPSATADFVRALQRRPPPPPVPHVIVLGPAIAALADVPHLAKPFRPTDLYALMSRVLAETPS